MRTQDRHEDGAKFLLLDLVAKKIDFFLRFCHTNQEGFLEKPDLMSESRQRKLTPKQELFIIEYAKDFNATKAAIRAGYSKHTANEQGAQLLAKLSVLIQERKEQRLQAAGGVPASTKIDAIATLEQSLAMVTALAFYDPRKLYDGDNLKSPAQLTRRQALMVADFQVDENFVGVGDKAIHVGYTKKVRMVDRAPYLNMLLKWHGAFPAKAKEVLPATPPARWDTSGWTAEDWETFKQLRAKSKLRVINA